MSEAANIPDHTVAPDIGRMRSDSVIGNLVRVFQRRETILFLVSSNLRAGHRNKVLGNFWNLLDPLFFMGVYYLVFGIGLRQAGDDPIEFVVYLSIGILTYRFTDAVVVQSAICIRAYRATIHQVYFPKAIVPIAVCFSRLYDFLWALFVLVAVLLALGTQFTPHAAWAALALVIQITLCIGLAFIVAYVGAFFADTPNIIAVIMRLLFFASPIFYFARTEFGQQGIVPELYLPYYMLNPMAGLMDAYRDALLWGRMPDPDTLYYLGAVAAASLIFGFSLFSTGEGKFAKYI